MTTHEISKDVLTLTANTIRMLSAEGVEKAKSGHPGMPMGMAELGAGSGLFAKQFLDQLAARAPEVHARLRYTVIDGSQAMLDGIEETGVLADHADQVEKLCLTLPGLGDALPRAGLCSGDRPDAQ